LGKIAYSAKGNDRGGAMDKRQLQQKIKAIQSKREVLVQLLSQPELGTLRIDITQALEEMDDLLSEFAQTFPDLEL
jgi:hypothetical protein